MADETPKRTAAERRRIAEDALDKVLEGHLERARLGSVHSADVVIKAVATHAKIFGYGVPPETQAPTEPVTVEIKLLKDVA